MRLAKSNLFLLATLVLAFWLRRTGIEWGLPGGDHYVASYRPDEFSLFAWIRRMNPDRWDFNPHIYLNGTLLLFALAGFYKVLSFFGLVKISTSPLFYYEHVSEWAKFYGFGRVFMVGIGLLTVWAIYRAGRAAFGKTAGLVAALLYAIVPVHVISSKHLLVEPAATLWFALLVLFSFRIIQRGAWKDYLRAAIVLGSGSAVKINLAPLGILLASAHFLGKVKHWDLNLFRSAALDSKIWKALTLTGVSYLAFNPYLLFNLEEARKEAQAWLLTYHSWEYLGYGPLFTLTHLLPAGLGLWFFLGGVLACLFALFSRRREVWLLLLGLLINFYVSARTGTIVVKYTVTLLPFLTLLMGHFFVKLLEGPPVWRAVGAVFFAWVMLATLDLSICYNALFLRPDARDLASNWIKEQVPRGSKIAVLKEPYFHSPPVLYNQYFFLGRSREWRVERWYQVVNLEFEDAKIRKEAPDYVVISGRENRLFARAHHDFTQKDDWGRLESLLQGEGYERVKVFENRLMRHGKALVRNFPPDDWQQFLAEIRIYQRVSPAGG